MSAPTPARLSILVVDDSEIIRRRLCAMLAESPRLHVVAEAGEGLEAIRQFQRFRPQAVVLDIQMPGLSGVEVLRRIKAAAPQCAVVMVTSFDQKLFREVCGMFGADAFFHKGTQFELAVEFLNSLVPRLAPIPLKHHPELRGRDSS